MGTGTDLHLCCCARGCGARDTLEEASSISIATLFGVREPLCLLRLHNLHTPLDKPCVEDSQYFGDMLQAHLLSATQFSRVSGALHSQELTLHTLALTCRGLLQIAGSG